MNYALATTLLASLTFLFPQVQPHEAVEHSCPMHAMTPHAAEHQNTVSDAPPQSAEQRHHAFLAEEREAIARGEGFGMAFPADHNGYPGPRHVLALQAELKLTPDQVSAMQKVFAEMREQALARGKEVLQAEDTLGQMFRDRQPETELHQQVLRVDSLRAELRWVHLRAHLSAAKLLTPEQIALYSRLRHEEEHQAPGAEDHQHEGVARRGDQVMGFSHEQAENPPAAPLTSGEPVAVNPDGPDCASFSPYATEPTHIWNRVHRRLLERRDAKGKAWGCDDVDPLLWPESKHVLGSPAYAETVGLLDEFTSTHAERLIRDPLPRALFQRDLWAVFDGLGRKPDDHPQERAELERRLAAILRAVALTPSEIRSLPDNYTQLRGSTTSDGLALPENSGGWLLIGRDDSTPAAAAHALFFPRSMFLVYLKLPRDGIEAAEYLNSMRAYSRERPRSEDCQQNGCNPPQFPVGTELALVRRAILMDAAGRPVVSPITESVQLRRYVSIGAGSRFDFDGSTQQVAEFQLTRTGLLHGTSGLRRVRKDETQFTVFMTQGMDAFEAGYHTPSAVLQRCHVCHQGIGVISFASYSRVQFGRDLFVPVHGTTEVEEAATAIKSLQSSDTWRLLQRLLQ